jgi:flagellar FliJ protein
MATFHFKLSPVLKHRQLIEHEKQRTYALALARLKELQDDLSSLNQSIQTSNTDVRDNHLVGRLNMAYLAAHRRYMLGLQRKGMDLVETMNAQQLKVDEARAALAEASRQKKILEKLRERQHAQWTADLARAEAGAADELATQMSHALLLELSEEPR